MDRLMAGERAANSGWNGALEFEGTQSIANSVWTRRDTEKKQSRVLARARLAQQHNQIGGAAQRPQGVTGQPRTPK